MIAALLIGMIAGLRTMTAPTAVAWAAHVGALEVANTWAGFLGAGWIRWLFTLGAIGELVVDKLPSTPSRKEPIGFGARIASGGLSGAAIGAASGATVAGLVAGVVGAVVGTLGGHAFRTRLAAAFGNDRPAALVEDAIALGGAVVVLALFR